MAAAPAATSSSTAENTATAAPRFVEAMREYEPTIPDEVVTYLLEKAGCNCSDLKVYDMTYMTRYIVNEW
jgi:hypothetical protein